MWLSDKTIAYNHFPAKFLRRNFPAKFLRRKRNEKLRQKKKKNMQQTFCLCFTSNIQLLHTQRKGGQLTAVPKPKANNGIRVQAHHQTSQELFFIVNLIIFGKRKVFLFSFILLLLLLLLLNFFDNLDLKKTMIKKCLKQIVG